MPTVRAELEAHTSTAAHGSGSPSRVHAKRIGPAFMISPGRKLRSRCAARTGRMTRFTSSTSSDAQPSTVGRPPRLPLPYPPIAPPPPSNFAEIAWLTRFSPSVSAEKHCSGCG